MPEMARQEANLLVDAAVEMHFVIENLRQQAEILERQKRKILKGFNDWDRSEYFRCLSEGAE